MVHRSILYPSSCIVLTVVDVWRLRSATAITMAGGAVRNDRGGFALRMTRRRELRSRVADG